MISFTKSYTVGDLAFTKLEDAQRHELVSLFTEHGGDSATVIATTILENADRIVDILTTTATSKPRARKVNGGKKTRTPKAASPTPPSV